VKEPCGNKKGVRILANAKLPTQYGKFAIIAFCNKIDGKEHVAVVRGKVRGKESVPLRIHSEWLTGDVFHSMKCDCHAQLDAALRKMGKAKCGVVLYMRQEGRGIGLTNKIRAYELQDGGMDTVQANCALGFAPDMRDYRAAAEMVKALGIRSIRLITNNPAKMEAMAKNGVNVSGRIAHEFGKTKYNEAYLKVKKSKMRHILNGV